MSAMDRLRMLSKTALSTQLHRTLATISVATSEQESPTQTEVAGANDVPKETWYKISDYEHLLETKLIRKHQLRQMIYKLNQELWRGRHFPRHLTPERMQELILLPSWNKKKRFLLYYRDKEEREWRRQNPRSPQVYDKPIIEVWTATDKLPGYGLFRNALFLRTNGNTLSSALETKVVHFLPFAQKVALDFAYDHLMTPREMNKLSMDVSGMLSENRTSAAPLNLHFCSFDPGENSSAQLVHRKVIGNRTYPFPYEVSPKSVVDLFPREQIVYLTPEGTEVLEKMDPSLTYVLGALVDKKNKPGASADRARELGVRSMRFPASFSLRWQKHGDEKPLHLPHCSRILSELSRGATWEEAVKLLCKNFAVDFEL